MWFLAWAITSFVLLGAMLFQGRLVIRNHAMLETMEKMQEELQKATRVKELTLFAIIKVGKRHSGLAKELCGEMLTEIKQVTLKEIEEANGG